MSERLVMIGRGLTVAVSGLLLVACPGREDEPAPPAQPIEIPDPEVPQAPTTPTALTRSDFMAAARQAASIYALGGDAIRPDIMVGRTFSVVTPVGCGAPIAAMPTEANDGIARVAWGPERRTLQFSLTPGDWTESALITGASGDWESVEGVWLVRPWLDGEACPVVRADPLQSGTQVPVAQTVGMAVVHSSEGSRLERRAGRAWAYVVRGEGDVPATLPEGGWRLRLEGRVTGFPDGGAFRCRASGPDAPPVCIAAVQLDRVALETTSAEVLSEWRGG